MAAQICVFCLAFLLGTMGSVDLPPELIIWNVGQRIANNTIQLSLLNKTNDAAAAILTSAVGIISATGAIQGHAAECPGCPNCVLGPAWQR